MNDIKWLKKCMDIENNPIWNDAEPFGERAAWVDLLFLADDEEGRTVILENGEERVLRPGQIRTDFSALAEKWHWDEDEVKSFLTSLKNHCLCEFAENGNEILLSINDYEEYRSGE